MEILRVDKGLQAERRLGQWKAGSGVWATALPSACLAAGVWPAPRSRKAACSMYGSRL